MKSPGQPERCAKSLPLANRGGQSYLTQPIAWSQAGVVLMLVVAVCGCDSRSSGARNSSQAEPPSYAHVPKDTERYAQDARGVGYIVQASFPPTELLINIGEALRADGFSPNERDAKDWDGPKPLESGWGTYIELDGRTERTRWFDRWVNDTGAIVTVIVQYSRPLGGGPLGDKVEVMMYGPLEPIQE